MSSFEERLGKYLPEGTISFVLPLLVKHKVKLILTRERTTKLGDYRHPHKHHGHTITLNVTLGPYQFLITLVHEIAHLLVWEQYQNKVAPHGKEWKQCFGNMMVELAQNEQLPHEFRQALLKSSKNPGASSVTDRHLFPVLKLLDPPKVQDERAVLLNELMPGSKFIFKDLTYTYIEKRRTKILIRSEEGKSYLLNHFASVIRI